MLNSCWSHACKNMWGSYSTIPAIWVHLEPMLIYLSQLHSGKDKRWVCLSSSICVSLYPACWLLVTQLLSCVVSGLKETDLWITEIKKLTSRWEEHNFFFLILLHVGGYSACKSLALLVLYTLTIWLYDQNCCTLFRGPIDAGTNSFYMHCVNLGSQSCWHRIYVRPG